jgi:hypothetical protein
MHVSVDENFSQDLSSTLEKTKSCMKSGLQGGWWYNSNALSVQKTGNKE